jgi:hypothetical protein
MIFLPLPIIISFIINLILAILILIYAGNIFSGGWFKYNGCPVYYRPGYPSYPDARCRHLEVAMKILIGISSGLGFLVG